MSTATPETSLIAEPGPPPRALTPRVRRWCWTEPSIRLWWLLALALLAAILYFCGSAFQSWRSETNLIRNGIKMTAQVTEGGHFEKEGQLVGADTMVVIRYEWNGKPIEQSGYLRDRVDPIRIGEFVPIRVSPEDPSVWTSRTQTSSLISTMFSGLLFLPGVPVLAGIAWWSQRRLVRLWTSGQPAVGVVHMVRQSPIAPQSYALHCTYRDRRGKRLFTVYVPHRPKKPAKGDTLWLLAPPIESKARPLAWEWVNRTASQPTQSRS